MLASGPEERDFLHAVLLRKTSSVTVVSSLYEANIYLSEGQFHVAIVDENFSGLNTGWELASKFRQKFGTKVSIIILARDKEHAYRYFGQIKYSQLFDWILAFPFSEDQLLGEIDRRLIVQHNIRNGS